MVKLLVGWRIHGETAAVRVVRGVKVVVKVARVGMVMVSRKKLLGIFVYTRQSCLNRIFDF